MYFWQLVQLSDDIADPPSAEDRTKRTLCSTRLTPGWPRAHRSRPRATCMLQQAGPPRSPKFTPDMGHVLGVLGCDPCDLHSSPQPAWGPSNPRMHGSSPERPFSCVVSHDPLFGTSRRSCCDGPGLTRRPGPLGLGSIDKAQIGDGVVAQEGFTNLDALPDTHSPDRAAV